LSGPPVRAEQGILIAEREKERKKKEACSWNSLTWENGFLDEKNPHVKGRSLHT